MAYRSSEESYDLRSRKSEVDCTWEGSQLQTSFHHLRSTNHGASLQRARFGNPIPEEAKTVEEIERELLDSQRSISIPPISPPPPYNVLLSCEMKAFSLEHLDQDPFQNLQPTPLEHLLTLPSTPKSDFPVLQIQPKIPNGFPGITSPPIYLPLLPPTPASPGLQIKLENIPSGATGDNNLTIATLESHDKFSMMTEDDTLKLKSLQIYQLPSNHPSTSDFYHLMLRAKQSTLIGETHLFLRKLYPANQEDNFKEEETGDYVPPQYENCLGKLHAASATNTQAPKRVIDILGVSVGGSKNIKWNRKRNLLLEIEKLYECLLIVEEHRIRACISRRDKDSWKVEVMGQTGKMEKALADVDKLVRILCVSKGAMLVCRALPLIDRKLMYKVFPQILQCFPMWGWDPVVEANAFVYLKECIEQTEEIGSLITFMGTGVTDNHEMLSWLVGSKLGVTLLLCIFHQAEHILRLQCDQRILLNCETLWTKYSIGGISAMLQNNEKLPQPLELFPGFLQHLQRFPYQRKVLQIFKAVFQRWSKRY